MSNQILGSITQQLGSHGVEDQEPAVDIRPVDDVRGMLYQVSIKFFALLQSLLRPHPLCDVEKEGEHSDDGRIRVTDVPFMDFENQAAAVGSNVVAFEGHQALLPSHLAAHGFAACGLPLGSYKLPNMTAEHTILVQAEELAFGRIDIHDLPRDIN